MKRDEEAIGAERSESAVGVEAGAQTDARDRLKRSAIGWGGAAVIGAVFLSPALGLYANIGPVVATGGNIAPILWLIGGALAMLNATNYAMVSRKMPAAGSAFTWSWNLLHPRVGGWVGWVMLMYYLTFTFAIPLIFGLFFNAFLEDLGAATGYWTWAVGVVLCSAAVAVPAYRSIEVGTKTVLGFLLFETLVVFALAVTLLVVHASAGNLSMAPLNPGNASSSSDFFLALVFAVFAYTGFDTVSTVAEETDTPRQKVPQATIAAVALCALFWLFATYALSYALPLTEVQDAVANDLTPVGRMAASVWGIGSLIVNLSAMTAALAVYLALAMSTSRVIYAQSRDGFLPGIFQRLHARHRSPWNALHLIFLIAVPGTLVGAAIVGITNFYLWIVSTIMFWALIMYSAAAIGNYLVHRSNSGVSRFTTVVIPLLALLLNAYLFYKFYFDVLWNAGFAYGQSITLACIAIAVLGVVYVAVLGRRKPEVFSKGSKYLDEVAG